DYLIHSRYNSRHSPAYSTPAYSGIHGPPNVKCTMLGLSEPQPATPARWFHLGSSKPMSSSLSQQNPCKSRPGTVFNRSSVSALFAGCDKLNNITLDQFLRL